MDTLTPMEAEEDADVFGGAGEHSQWCGIVKGGAGGVVEKEGSAFVKELTIPNVDLSIKVS